MGIVIIKNKLLINENCGYCLVNKVFYFMIKIFILYMYLIGCNFLRYIDVMINNVFFFMYFVYLYVYKLYIICVIF